MKKRADFYILSANNQQKRWLFTCQLLEKAFKNNLRCFVWTTDDHSSEQFDELLWNFKETSFVPHELIDASAKNIAPILIGKTLPQTETVDALINLTDNLPLSFDYARIFEIINNDPGDQQKARKRFKEYKKLGFELNSHRV